MKKLLGILLVTFVQLSVMSMEIIPSEQSTFPEAEAVSEVEPYESVQLECGVSFDNDNAIYLDDSIQRPMLNIKSPNTLIPVYTPTFNDSRMRSRSALAQSSKLSGEEYYIAPIFHYLQEQTGHFSYGTYYGASMDSAQMTYSTNLFTRYDAKRAAITGTVSTDSQSIDGSYKNMLGVSPELKLTKSLSVRDTVKTYVGLPVKKNSLSIIYTPQFEKYIDSLRFELGMSQSFYENGVTNSSVEFSTKFKL